MSFPNLEGFAPELLSSALLADVLDALGQRQSALPIDNPSVASRVEAVGPAATLSAVTVAAEPARPTPSNWSASTSYRVVASLWRRRTATRQRLVGECCRRRARRAAFTASSSTA